MQAAVLAAACAARAACGGEASVTLGAFTAGSFRWKDIAGNAYSAAYRSAYSYSQAEVTVTYTTINLIPLPMLNPPKSITRIVEARVKPE